MHSRTLIALLAVSLAVLSAHAETFLRPSTGWLVFQNSGYSNKPAFGLAAGRAFGEDDAHEVSLEFSHADWEYLLAPDSAVMGASTTGGSGRFQPLLLNYRYRFGTADAKVRLYGGASAGFARVHGDAWQVQPVAPPNGDWVGSTSGWRGSWGVALGVEIQLTKRLALDAGYQLRAVAGPEATLHPRNSPANNQRSLDLPDLTAHVISAGLRCSF